MALADQRASCVSSPSRQKEVYGNTLPECPVINLPPDTKRQLFPKKAFMVIPDNATTRTDRGMCNKMAADFKEWYTTDLDCRPLPSLLPMRGDHLREIFSALLHFFNHAKSFRWFFVALTPAAALSCTFAEDLKIVLNDQRCGTHLHSYRSVGVLLLGATNDPVRFGVAKTVKFFCVCEVFLFPFFLLG